MRYVKMLGLAAIAAAAVMAFIGAGTASATVLCEVTPAPGSDCEAANHVKAGTELDFSLEPKTSALLKGPFGETIATCTESTAQGLTENTGGTGETVKATLTETKNAKGEPVGLSFGGCNHPVTTKLAGTLEIHHIAGSDNGTVTSTGATVIIDETLFGNCQYKTEATPIGTLTGRSVAGGTPTFDISAKITSENGCPQGTWSGSYVYTGSTNFDVAAG